MFARFLFKATTRSSVHRISTRNISARPNGKSAQIENSSVNVQWSDGKSGRFHGIWLRDHCHCPKCYHPETKQRLVNTVEIPINIRPASVKVLPERDSLEVVWDTKDKHRTEFELPWLRHHSYDPKLAKDTEVLANETKVLWDSESMEKALPVTEYEEVMQSDKGLAKWLRNTDTYGLAFVDNVPISKEETERLARRICFVRESHFGGFWDFTANMAHADTAYTTLPLRAHTDTTYFTDSVGLQMFHLLEFNGKGGESLFVDGFHVAEQLRRNAPEAYKTLSTVLIPSHCAGDKETFILPTPRARPILNLDPVSKNLFQVRYNNDDRSPLSPALSPSISADQIEAFYAALKEWSSLLQKRSNEFWIPLKPGRVAIFDNWRVLHGRSAFSGHRRLIGTYLNWDDYRSRVRTVAGEGGPGGLERWQL